MLYACTPAVACIPDNHRYYLRLRLAPSRSCFFCLSMKGQTVITAGGVIQIANRCYLNQVGDETCSQVAATFSAEVKIGFAPPENVRGVKMLPAAEKSSSLRITD